MAKMVQLLFVSYTFFLKLTKIHLINVTIKNLQYLGMTAYNRVVGFWSLYQMISLASRVFLSW